MFQSNKLLNILKNSAGQNMEWKASAPIRALLTSAILTLPRVALLEMIYLITDLFFFSSQIALSNKSDVRN